jgi:hypothetical protein
MQHTCNTYGMLEYVVLTASEWSAFANRVVKTQGNNMVPVEYNLEYIRHYRLPKSYKNISLELSKMVKKVIKAPSLHLEKNNR